MHTDIAGVSSPYASPKGGWEPVLAAAEKVPHLRHIVANYRRTKHPACLNGIMTNAPVSVWHAHITGIAQ